MYQCATLHLLLAFETSTYIYAADATSLWKAVVPVSNVPKSAFGNSLKNLVARSCFGLLGSVSSLSVCLPISLPGPDLIEVFREGTPDQLVHSAGQGEKASVVASA